MRHANQILLDLIDSTTISGNENLLKITRAMLEEPECGPLTQASRDGVVTRKFVDGQSVDQIIESCQKLYGNSFNKSVTSYNISVKQLLTLENISQGGPPIATWSAQALAIKGLVRSHLEGWGRELTYTVTTKGKKALSEGAEELVKIHNQEAA